MPTGSARPTWCCPGWRESLRDKAFTESYGLFEDREKKADLGDLPILPTPAVWSLTFWDRSYRVDVEAYRQVKAAIWSVLFPTIEEEPWHRLSAGIFADVVHGPEMKTWRNAWCDVHNPVTHIDHHQDLFMSANTTDNRRHAQKRRHLGIKRILTPLEACALGRSSSNLH